MSRVSSDKDIKMRIFPLTRAIKTKDGLNWSYRSAEGNKRIDRKVPINSLGKIDTENKFSYKSYTALKSQIEVLFQEILSKHQKSLNVKVEKVKVVAPIATVVVKPEVEAKVIVPIATPISAPILVSKSNFSGKNLEDQKAVESMLAGNKNAFTGIYKRYYAMIRQKYMTSIRFNQEIIDDLVQDLFIKVSENISKYSPEYTFNSWITRVAHNHLVDYIRKGKLDTVSYDNNVFNDEGDEISFQPKDEDSRNGEEILIDNESKTSLRKALDMLDETTRKILMLRYFEELSYEEITKQENISLTELKTLLFRAKGKLNKILQANRGLMTACSNYISCVSSD